MAVFRIAEHDVQFPHETCYGVQIAFMDKLIHAVSASSHALLEAPTGTGKTLAILCGVLAWQSKFKETVAAAAEAEELALEQLALPDACEKSTAHCEAKPVKAEEDCEPCNRSPVCEGASCKKEQSPSQDVLHQAADAPPSSSTACGAADCCKREDSACKPQQSAETSAPGKAANEHQRTHQGKQTTLPGFAPVTKTAGVPRIYYATRTHSQIAQVVQELKRTTYKPSIAILGAKKHYCIHEQVLKGDVSVDEGCEMLMDASGCKYKKPGSVQEFLPLLQRKEDMKVHDIEELVTTCKRRRVCPYFVARALAEHAELVFCPYNYIIDPTIRKSVQIELQNAVVVFDEAHNIEDVCRESASIDVPRSALLEALRDIQDPVENYSTPGDADPGHYRQLYAVLQGALGRMLRWLDSIAQSPALRKVDTDRHECVWSGGQIRQKLEEAGLGPASLADLSNQLNELQQHLREVKMQKEETAGRGGKDDTSDKTARFALALLERLFLVLHMLYRAVEGGPSSNDACDYRLVVSHWLERGSGQRRSGKYRGRQARDVEEAGWQSQLSLWCLNPACIFAEIGRAARTVVVTSGTLSPMTSMASELGLKFAEELEGPHVVPNERVLPLCITRSPKNHAIKAVFAESNKETFQDGVGDAIQAIARAVPDGMLVFMPSYGYLDKLKRRWEETKLWERLQKIKPIWVEPRSAEELESSIGDFYEAVRSGRGALYFAVCRGKVSEGINFANANARAVVVLGIPFPNVRDSKVSLKQAYNNASIRRGLVSGNTWYKQQAFRAMNQALGRCIRHRNDWGAIILLDERLRYKDNQICISKWLRGRIYSAPQFDAAIARLSAFCVQRTDADKQSAGALVHAPAGNICGTESKVVAALPSCGDPASKAAQSSAQAAVVVKTRWNDSAQAQVRNSIASMFSRPADGVDDAVKDARTTAAADAPKLPVGAQCSKAGVKAGGSSTAHEGPVSTAPFIPVPKAEDTFVPVLESVCGVACNEAERTQAVTHLALPPSLNPPSGHCVSHQSHNPQMSRSTAPRYSHLDAATQRVEHVPAPPVAGNPVPSTTSEGWASGVRCTPSVAPAHGVTLTQATQSTGLPTQQYVSVSGPGHVQVAALPRAAAPARECANTTATALSAPLQQSQSQALGQSASHAARGACRGGFARDAQALVASRSDGHHSDRSSSALSMLRNVSGTGAAAGPAFTPPPAAAPAASPSSVYCTPSAASLGFASVGCDSERTMGVQQLTHSNDQRQRLPSPSGVVAHALAAAHRPAQHSPADKQAAEQQTAASVATPPADERSGCLMQLVGNAGALDTPGFTSASQLLQQRRRSSSGGAHSDSVPPRAGSGVSAARQTPPPLTERLQNALAVAHGASEGGLDTALNRVAKRARHESTQQGSNDAGGCAHEPRDATPSACVDHHVKRGPAQQLAGMGALAQTPGACKRALPPAGVARLPSTTTPCAAGYAHESAVFVGAVPQEAACEAGTVPTAVVQPLPDGWQSYLDSGMFAEDFCDDSDDNASDGAPASDVESMQLQSLGATQQAPGQAPCAAALPVNAAHGSAAHCSILSATEAKTAPQRAPGAALHEAELSQMCEAWIESDIARLAAVLGQSRELSSLSSAAARSAELRGVLMDAVVQAGRAERSGALETWLREFAVTPLGVVFVVRHADSGNSSALRCALRDKGLEASDGTVAVLGHLAGAGLSGTATMSVRAALGVVIDLYRKYLAPGAV